MRFRHLPIARLLIGLTMAAAVTWSGAATAELKIGYVNAVKVIEEAPQGEAALKKLEAEFGPRDKKLVEMQARIKEMEEELGKNTLVLKEADRRALEHRLNIQRRELRRATQEFREDYNLRRNEELAALQKVVQRAIIEVARQERYDLILHEGVLFASGKTDITNQILKKLGKQLP